MKQTHIPQGYNTIMPYLIVKDGLGLIQFLKDVFGAVEKEVHYTEDGKTLMHGEVIINNDSCVMISEASDKFPVQTAGLYINVADADETYATALGKGATSIMPPANQPYGRSGGITDPHGNTWWVTSAL